jgi:hypothetical protein
MKLFFKTNLLGEIAHYYDIVTKDIIISKANKFYVTINKFEHIIKLPLSSIFLFILSKFRLTRRLFRIDKSNAIFNFKKDGVIIIYLKKIYFYDLVKKKLFVAGNLINSKKKVYFLVSMVPIKINKGFLYGVPMTMEETGRLFTIFPETQLNMFTVYITTLTKTICG